MNKTKIEWCDYTINPVKGLCPVGCPYCYARAMYKRFKHDESLSYHDEVFKGVHSLRNPSRIFVGSTIDLFHEKTSGLFPRILEHVRHSPWHTFIFLTKCPENLRQFSPFPDNCWVGVSATDNEMFNRAIVGLSYVEAPVKFISVEPLLSWDCSSGLRVKFRAYHLDWIIVGQRTPVRKSTMPSIEWIQDIVQAADQACVPVFLKNNLISLMPRVPIYPDTLLDVEGKLRQEWPEVKNDSVIR